MTLVMDVCETIYVLDYGRTIAVGLPEAVRPTRRWSRPTWARPRGSGDGRNCPPAGAGRRFDVHIETEVPPLELIGVRAAYGGIEVLHGIDLAVHGGEVVALLGANGAGKSTTVKVAAGVLRPTAGGPGGGP